MKRWRSWRGTLAILLFLVSSCLLAQRFSDPPLTFRDTDLVGVWKADYERHGKGKQWRGSEVLTLGADGTFQQVYEGGSKVGKSQGAWRVEHLPDGRVRLWLEGGRFYPDMLESNTPFEQLYGYHTNNDGTGHPLDIQAGRAVLIVQVRSDNPSEIRLVYPAVGDPDSPVIVTFQRQTVLIPAATVVP